MSNFKSEIRMVPAGLFRASSTRGKELIAPPQRSQQSCPSFIIDDKLMRGLMVDILSAIKGVDFDIA